MQSGAIIEYLLDTYDKSNSLSYTSFPQKYQQKSWEAFQMSGQGPYFGQRAWFMMYHPEKNITSAIERYGTEIKRVLGVIDAHLRKTGQPYLVGDKLSYADLMFVPWNWLLPFLMEEGFEKECEQSMPHYWAWYQKLQERPSVSKCRKDRENAMAAAKH